MKLDHVTIVAPDCEPIRHFLVDIAGMKVGPRLSVWMARPPCI